MALLMINIASAEKYFVLDVNNFLGSVTFNSISLREIDAPVKNSHNSGFSIRTMSFDEKELGLVYYGMDENKNYIIYIPYSENAARITVTNPQSSTIMDIDVSSYADTCGNDICEGHESYESCTKDCKSGGSDDFCDKIGDNICDPDCSPKLDSDCKGNAAQNQENKTKASTSAQSTPKKTATKKPAEQEPDYLAWVFAAFGLLIGFLLLVLWAFTKRRENKMAESLKPYVSESMRRGYDSQQIKDSLLRAGYAEKIADKALKFT